jgi:hypothetical protein
VAGAALETRATVAARAALIVREPVSRRLAKRQAVLYVTGLSATEPLENKLTILIAKGLPQLVEADNPGFEVRFLSKEICHRLRQLAIVCDTRR